MRIAFMRTGTVLYADNGQASPVAGNQDALGVLRYLKQSGHEVCIFGPVYGDHGVPVFNVDFSHTPYQTTPKEEYVFRTRLALSELRRWAPEVCVNVAGQQPSHSNPCNPWGTSPLRTAITTNFPCLLACEELNLPRIVILNDPRNLPREHENHYMPRTLPTAVLSQRSKISTWDTRERRMRREEVYAGCENWWSYGIPYAPLDGERRGTVVMAHSHAHDLRVYGPERAKVWDALLGRCDSKYDIYGHGWAYCEECKTSTGEPLLRQFSSPEEVEEHRRETGHLATQHPNWRGCIKHDQVQGTLQRYANGPMLALEAGFATGKLREYVLAGVLPRLVTGGKFTYDSVAQYLPLDHPTRIKIDNTNEPWGEMYDRDLISRLRIATEPDFGPLEQAIAGSDKWGGYRWLTGGTAEHTAADRKVIRQTKLASKPAPGKTTTLVKRTDGFWAGLFAVGIGRFEARRFLTEVKGYTDLEQLETLDDVTLIGLHNALVTARQNGQLS